MKGLKTIVIEKVSIISIFIILMFPCFGEENENDQWVTIDSVFQRLEESFSRVNDYTVKINISVEMPGFRMPKKKVKLYFKSANSSNQQDKIKIETEGFAVVPRSGLEMSSEKLLNTLVNPQVIGVDISQNSQLWIIEGGIVSDSAEEKTWTFGREGDNQVSMKLWVDLEKGIIPKVETYMDTMKVMTVQSTFGEYGEQLRLPEVTEIRFYIGGDFVKGLKSRGQEPFSESHLNEDILPEGGFQGFIRMEFNHYKINQGLKDEIFEETYYE